MKKPFIVSLVLGLLMVSASVLTMVLTPSVDIADQQNQIDLEALIPSEFNGWKIDKSIAPPLVNADEKEFINKIYSQTLSRTYINNQGERVMLSIAYGGNQKKDLQVHRPEVCYRANGFSIGNLTKAFVDTTIGRIPVMHLVAKQGARNEPITYWIRVGDSVTRGWFEQKAAAISYGLTGKVPDGLLFRVSTISNDEQVSYRVQQTFVTTLLQAVRSEDRHWLVGQLAQS
jgi:EpsI family protein